MGRYIVKETGEGEETGDGIRKVGLSYRSTKKNVFLFFFFEYSVENEEDNAVKCK